MMNRSSQQLLAHVSSDLDTLPEEDLVLVASFVTYLKRRQIPPAPRTSATTLRIEALRWAAALRDVPRAELVPRFQQTAEEVCQQAIAQSTAIEGDWERD